MSIKGIIIVVALSLAVASSIRAQTIRPSEPPPFDGRRGLMNLTFTERHPLGALKEQMKRFEWTAKLVAENDPAKGVYAIEDQTFVAYVPENYDGTEDFGLLVWINAGPSGSIPVPWPSALANKKVITCGADHSDNDREIWYRVGLALDGAWNMPKRFRIDPRRIYIAGFSGGGKVASRIGIHYPDVFSGGIYMGGCNWYRRVEKPGPDGFAWPAHFPKPKGKFWDLTRKSSRHVFCFGADDFNKDNGLAYYRMASKSDGFKHATFLEMPGKGHEAPDAEWLEKAISALDEPLIQVPTSKPTSRPAAASGEQKEK